MRTTKLTSPSRALNAVTPYIPALDGLRGLAIIAVLLHNLSNTGDPAPTTLSAVLEWGWVGVQLFFVLSGFLITRILLETRDVPGALLAFFARRALRLLPLYYLVLAVYFLVLPHVIDAPTVRAAEPHQIWYWLLLSNWSEPAGYGAPGLGHFWSIAVEAQFYLLWPILVTTLGQRRLARLCIAIVVISLTSKIALRLGFAGSASMVYKSTLTRMSALTIGGLVAVVARHPPWRATFERHVLTIGLVVASALVALLIRRPGLPHEDILVQTVGFTLVSIFFAVWVLVIVCDIPALGGLATWLPARASLRALGRLSYGMYVLHYPLHWAAMKPLHRTLQPGADLLSSVPLAAYVVGASVVTYGLAWLSWQLLEKRVLRLKRYFQVGRAPA
jgi:peptidoglycan/LPS O-acetylase OafA/YrhL